MSIYLGLDVHSRRTVFVAQEDSGKVLKRGDVDTSVDGFKELSSILGGECGLKVGLESGAQSFWASDVLNGLGMVPYVIDAAEVRAKSRRRNQKSDSRDAFEICDGLRRDIYVTIVHVPGEDARRLRRIVYRRRHFVRICTGQVNAAKSLFRASGVSLANHSLSSRSGWHKLFSRAESYGFYEHVKMHGDLWSCARSQVEHLEAELEEAIEPFRTVYNHLITVPGVGQITAATFIAVIADPFRFDRSGQVVSYLGLAPSSWDSGDRVVHGRITRRGNPEARAMLVEAAHQAHRVRHPLNPYFTRACAKGGYNKAVVCVAQRLARILWRLWVDDQDFKVKELNVVPEKRSKKKTYYYRLKKPGESVVRV